VHACCSVEHVVSGTGIGITYEFLAHKHPDKVDPAVHAEIQAAGLSNRARVITDPVHATVSTSYAYTY
jgi:glucokinase